MPGPSAGSSCPGSALQTGGVGTWPCVSDRGSKAAAGAAAEPPSGGGEVFGLQSAPDLHTAGEGKGFRSQRPGPET